MWKLVLAISFVAISAAGHAQTLSTEVARRPDDPQRLHIALAAIMAAQGADLATTMYALGTKRFDEANASFDGLTHTPWLAGAMKMSVAVGFSYVMLRYHREHPRAAFWITVAAAGGYSALAVHNARVAGQLR
jgi:hypothetical protein